MIKFDYIFCRASDILIRHTDNKLIIIYFVLKRQDALCVYQNWQSPKRQSFVKSGRVITVTLGRKRKISIFDISNIIFLRACVVKISCNKIWVYSGGVCESLHSFLPKYYPLLVWTG